MEGLIIYENYSINNIIFLDFLNKSNEVLKLIPENPNVFEEFEIKNKINRENYYRNWKRFIKENKNNILKEKQDIILDWAKQNEYPLSSKYDENDLNSLIDIKLFPELTKMLDSLHSNNSLLLKLLSYHIINNLTHSIEFLLSIKNIYLKKKTELMTEKQNYDNLFEQSENTEKEFQSKKNSLEKKIDRLKKEKDELSSKNETLSKENKILKSDLNGYTIAGQINERSMAELKYEMDLVKNQLKDVQNKLEESENKYDELISLMKETLSEFSSDLTIKIKNNTEKIQNKLDAISKKKEK